MVRMIIKGGVMRKIVIALAAIIATGATHEARADDGNDAVNSAYFLCALIDKTGLASEPCDVSGGGGSVDATIDMNSGEARTLCTQIAGMMRDKGKRFPGRQWKLKIKSPYSNGPIAYCNLPQ
jgi:hypothetical protein